MCYSDCPKLTYADKNVSQCKCSYGWHYNSTTEEKICYDGTDYCLSLEYYYHTDDKECVLNDCKNGYYKINFECYKDKCPENSKQISPNIKKCESTLKYCYIDEHYKTKCSNNPFSGYDLKFNDTHTYFQSCNDSLYYFNIQTYLYNKTCYQYCPEETITNETSKRCSCKYYIFYIDSEKSDYECLKETEKCWDKNRYNVTDQKLCVATQQECLDLGYKVYNDECRYECPTNTIKDREGDAAICLCKHYFYNDSNILDCFEEGITCENKNYPIKSDNDTLKECFKTVKDCLSKNHLYYYDQNCYQSNCPSDKIPLNSLPELNRTKIINELNLEEFFRDKLCICDTSNTYKGWVSQENNPSIQECLNECPEYYDLDPTTRKCYYSCDPKKDYVFNNICYKNQCPEGTYLQDPNSDIRTCVCKEKSEIDSDSGLTACEFTNPDLFYTDRNNCKYVYNNKCYSQCPQNTCLTTITKELVNCVDYKSNMKIYNSICIEGIKEYVKSLEGIEDDDDIIPIITPSGVVLNAFSSEADIEKLIDKYPNLTFVDLGECKDKLREAYNLPQNIKFYIIGIDTPNLYGSSSINVFNYELYLKNGTQLDDLSSCDKYKIILSSHINDLDSIKFYKAKDFYEDDGYDIYNKSDIFYIDRCASAEDEGNDITLEDRTKYYYPNVSICNEGCIYKFVDYKKKRFVCNCNADLTQKYKYNEDINEEKIDIEDNKEKEEEDDESYIDYFLSLINYEIFTCANLFLKFKHFYKNAGFYIGFITLIACIVLFFIFWVKGVKHIRLIMYRNIPTKQKLREIIRKQEERHRRMLNGNINNTINDIKHINIEEIDTPKILNMSNSFKGFKNIKNINFNKDDKNINNEDNISPKNSNSNSALKDFKNMHLQKYKSSTNIINNNKNTNDSPSRNINESLKYSLFLKHINFGKHGEKEVEIYNIYKTRKKSNSIKRPKKYGTARNPIINKNKYGGYYSSKENMLKFYNKYMEEKSAQQKESNNNIDIYNLNQNNNNENEQNKSLKLSINEENDSKELFNSSKLNKSVNKRNTVCLNKNKINFDLIHNKNRYDKFDSASTNLRIKGKMKEDLELNIDLNFTHLIDRTDDEIENRELNNVPYRQALRIDKRSIFEIFISVFTNEVDLLSLFFYRNPYSHFSLYVSIYLYDLLLDLTMNCFLYTDDVVSEKYHNNGQLSMITSFSLSLMSNIISSIIVFIISKLTNYCDIIEEIIKNVKYKRNYFENIIRLFKYIKIRLGIFYFLQLTSLLVMTYYLFVFCAVYDHSQGSIFINYLIGSLISLATSTGLTIIITFLRAISIKYRSVVLFNVSKYLYEHF